MDIVEVTTTQQAAELIRICPEVISMDTEYVPGDPRFTKLTSVIIADERRAWVITPTLLPQLTPMITARKAVFLQDYNHCDTLILLKHGCDLRQTPCYNLIDMCHLIDENIDKSLGSRVLNTYGDDYKSRLKGQFEDLEYQGKDGIYAYRLGVSDLQKLSDLGLLSLYDHVRRTSLALLETEISGIVVDVPLMTRTKHELSTKINEYLPKLRKEFKDACTEYELEKWETEIYKRSTPKRRAGVPRPKFSFSSDKQIRWLLYDHLRLPVLQKTKKRNPSTDYKTLKSLSERHPELKTLVEYKSTKSLYSTFVKGMLDKVVEGRIYPHFNVSGTDTGRLSHSNPNMANLPTDGVIRNFFKPTPGYVLMGADYAQLEVVVEANLTNDPNLIRIITEGVSKHDITAEGLGIDRSVAKTLNFALQYGAGARKVKSILGVSQFEADGVFKRYWELYSGVSALKSATDQTLEKTGKLTNLFGRTRHFPKPENEFEASKQSRQAYNFLIQGVAGDACNRAFWQFSDYLKSTGYGRVLFSVHDEIVAEVKPEHVEVCKQKLCQIMEAVSDHLQFKFRLQSKPYGPLEFWAKT